MSVFCAWKFQFCLGGVDSDATELVESSSANNRQVEKLRKMKMVNPAKRWLTKITRRYTPTPYTSSSGNFAVADCTEGGKNYLNENQARTARAGKKGAGSSPAENQGANRRHRKDGGDGHGQFGCADASG